jgi:hypothetical protein
LLPSDRSSTTISLAYSDDLDLAAKATSLSAQRAGRSCRHRTVLTAPAVGASRDPDLPPCQRTRRTATDIEPSLLRGLLRPANASRMSRARLWRERCGEADAARVTLPKATAPSRLLRCYRRSPGRRSGRRLHTLVRRPPRSIKLPRSSTNQSAVSNPWPSWQRRAARCTALINVVFPSSRDASQLRN